MARLNRFFETALITTLRLQTLPSKERADLRPGQNALPRYRVPIPTLVVPKVHAYIQYLEYLERCTTFIISRVHYLECLLPPRPLTQAQTRLLSLEIEICFELATRPPAASFTFRTGRDFSLLYHLHIHTHNTT